MKQPDVPSDVLLGKLVELAVVVIDHLIFIVPGLMAAAGLFAVAWLNRRTKQFKTEVREAAVEAEKKFGAKAGTKKHAHVSAKIKKTWSMSDDKLDKAIQDEVDSAEFRESLPPEPPN